jgi:hypothetical protein
MLGVSIRIDRADPRVDAIRRLFQEFGAVEVRRP